MPFGDAPPPMGTPPPPSGGMPQDPMSGTDALSDMAGMGPQGGDISGLFRQAGQLLLKAAQEAQMEGDQATTAALAEMIRQLTDMAASRMQGMEAGPMAGNGMGPPPGPAPGGMPPMLSPAQQTPTPMMLPRSSMMGP